MGGTENCSDRTPLTSTSPVQELDNHTSTSAVTKLAKVEKLIVYFIKF